MRSRTLALPLLFPVAAEEPNMGASVNRPSSLPHSDGLKVGASGILIR